MKSEISLKPTTEALLFLTESPYTEYNAILPVIKTNLGEKAAMFEQILSEELPLTTARRAYKTAIKVANGEPDVYREFPPDSVGRNKSKKLASK